MLKKIIKNKYIRFLPFFLVIIGLLAWWFFSPEHGHIRGARAGYLKLTETSDYFHIQSDVYGIRIYKTSSDSYVEYYNASSTEIAYGRARLRTSDGTAYEAIYDTNRTVQLIENNPNRMVIKIKGKFDQTYGASSNYLTDGTNDVEYTAYYYIYPDYFNYKIDINAYNGVSLINSYIGSFLLYIKQESGYFDSGKRYYGTTTGEALASNYGVYSSADYGAVLATSTVDWQVVKLSENHSGTSTFAFSFVTETAYQNIHAILNNGNLKGEASASFAVRPWTDSTAEQRRAWAAAMIGADAPTMSVGAATEDWENEIFEPFNADGSYHLTADNNKVKFTLHGEADAYATLAATTTGGDTSLSITGDSGLADDGGTTTHWVQIGNRLPYGSFDVNDPDVLFYWDMDSATDGQAPNKGVGPISISNATAATGTAGNGLQFDNTNEVAQAPNINVNLAKGAISFWFKSISTSTTQYAHFFEIRSDASFSLRRNAANTALRFGCNGVYAYFTVPDLWDKNWHHIKVTWDADNDIRKIYIDGKLEDSDQTAFSPPSFTEPLLIGRGNNTNYYCNGIIDEFYISQDPDQPDAPSYYDVVSYTDKSGGTLTGIPEVGAGSIKWNHEPGAPVVQTTKPTPVFTIHNWHPKTKSTTTGEFVYHLVLDLPLDKTGSNENVNKVYDKVSGSWLGTTSAGVTFEQAVQGNGAKFDGNGEMIELEHSSNYLHSHGTIEFDFKMTSVSSAWGRFFSGGENKFELYRYGSNSYLTFIINDDESNISFNANLYDGQWHHIKVTWNDAADIKTLWIDGNFQGKATSTFSMPDSSMMHGFTVGNIPDGGRYLNGIIDNFRIYNDVILPYGAYYTGYEANGDYAHKHPDITFYDGLDSTSANADYAAGTSTRTQAGTSATSTAVNNNAIMFDASGDYQSFKTVSNININQGSLGMWFKSSTTTNPATSEYLFYAAANFNVYFDINGYINFQYQTGSSSVAASDEYDNKWHWLQIKWDYSNDEYAIYVDSVLKDFDTPNLDTPTLDADFYLGNNSTPNANFNGIIDEFYITNNPNTPQIPTAYGKPIIAPQLVLVETNGNSLKTMETDYDVAMLNDITSWLVKYNADVSAETTFLITESLNPPSFDGASAGVSSDRVAPLLSVSYTSGYAEITVQRGDGSWSDDFKLIFKEADAGVSECYLGQGAAGSWGSNLCGATDMLTEISQNSVAQEDQTSTLNLVQSTGAEVIVRNYFTLGSEATTTEDWHIFANGVIVKDIKYEKANGNAETREINSSFTNYTYYPATPSATRGAGVYHDSFLLHLTSANSDIQNDYLNPQAGATSTIGGFLADASADIDADGYAEGRGTYVLTANYTPDPSVPECPGVCGQPIYHTIGTSTATINATSTAVNQISSGLWLVQFSSPLDLSGIHKHDKFHDSAGNDWNIVLVDDTNDAVVVGNQEKNSGSPVTGAGTLGPWYNSLASWEAAEQRDLTATTRYANGEIEMAECWPLRDTTEVFIYGWTTGANNYIKVYTPLSVRHHGKWTSDSYRLETDGGDESLYIAAPWTIIDGLQVSNAGTSTLADVGIKIYGYGPQHDIIVSNNIIKGGYTSINYDSQITASDVNKNSIVFNNIVYNSYRHGIGLNGSSPLKYVYNNIVYNCNLGHNNWTRGINTNGGVAKNNIAMCWTGGTDNNDFDSNQTQSNNISADSSASGAGSITGAVATTTANPGSGTFVIFKSLASGDEDFHLVNSTANSAIGAGANLSAPVSGQSALFSGFSTDIDGEPRGGDWSIGADQVRDKWLNKVKFTFDASTQTIYQPRFLLQDFYPQSGKNGSEESYLLFYDPMDSIADGHEPKVGSGTVSVVGNIEVRNGYRNFGAYFSATSSWDDAFQFNTNGNIRDESGAISLIYIPDEETDNFSGYKYLFYSGNVYLRFSDDELQFYKGAAYVRLVDDSISNYGKRGLPINITAAWQQFDNSEYLWLIVNGKVRHNITNALGGFDTTINIGRAYNSNFASGTIDEFKIYSEPILPFGAYYTGYEQNGNYSGADPTLTFYWDAESEKARGGAGLSKEVAGSLSGRLNEDAALVGNRGYDNQVQFSSYHAAFPVNNEDIIRKDKGSIGLWFNLKDDGWLFGIGDSGDYIGAYINSSYAVGARYYLGGTSFSVISSNNYINNNEWHYLRVVWSDANNDGILKLYLDGKLIDSEVVTATWDDGTFTDLYFASNALGNSGADVYLDQIFITNSPYSQEIPTAFGKSLRAPLVKVDGVRQKYGYDYIVSWTPDPSAVIVQYFKNVTGTTFEIGEGEGTAQVIRLRGNIRLEGGVRF